MVSAPAQGIVTVACRTGEEDTIKKLKSIDNKTSRAQATAERKFLNLMEGGCTAPIGAFAKINGDQLELEVQVNSLDGSESVRLKVKGDSDSPENIAQKAFEAAKAQGAVEIVKSIKL